jgi:2-polyprenyl-3-methyl-5-hydroxy-6-metoxy-1,4-benzoquinol methylase
MRQSAPITTCSIPCNLCGGADVDVLAERDRAGQPLRTVICRACGLVWTDPRPSAADTRAFYAEHYRQHYKRARQPKLKHVYRDIRRAIQRYDRIKPLLRPGVKLLDIGAGGGFFHYVVNQRGHTVIGLEPNAGYADYAREEFQLDIQTGYIQEVNYTAESFDVVTLNHVLEHLEDPFLALTRIRGWLKPGGYLNLEVPNIEATYHAPGHKFHRAHLYSFNPATLRRLAVRAGFVITDALLTPGTRHINLILRKPAAPAAVAGPGVIPGNHAHIRRLFDAHTTSSHYLSWRPYLRLLRKLAAYAQEQITVRRFKRGREIADYLLEPKNQ